MSTLASLGYTRCIMLIACDSRCRVYVSARFTPTKASVKQKCSINHAETTVVFASSDHVQFLLKLAPSVPKLKLVVILDEVPVESKDILVAWGKDKNVQVLGLNDCMCMTSKSAIRLRINLLPT